LKEEKLLFWKHIDKVNGIPVVVVNLEHEKNSYYGIITVKTNTYLLPEEDYKSFLIWNRKL